MDTETPGINEGMIRDTGQEELNSLDISILWAIKYNRETFGVQVTPVGVLVEILGEDEETVARAVTKLQRLGYLRWKKT